MKTIGPRWRARRQWMATFHPIASRAIVMMMAAISRSATSLKFSPVTGTFMETLPGG